MRSAETRLQTVFDRSWHDIRRSTIGWSIGLVALGAMMLTLYPTVRDNEQMTQLLQSYPEAFRKMFNLDDYTSGPGYLRSEIFSFMGPLLLVLQAVLAGSDAIAGDEERHTLDLLLANPVTRRRVLAEKATAIAASLAVSCGALFAVLWIGGPVAGLHVGTDRLLAAIVSAYLIAGVYGALALCIGAVTGRRGLARGVTTALAVAAYFASTLAPLVTWLERIRPLSPWYHAFGIDPLHSGLRYGHLALLAALIAALLAVSAVGFERRDVGV